MSKTEENLAAAFEGESQANRKYLAYAQQADAEGYKQIAKLFRVVAEAETIHAHTHFRNNGGVRSTAENLQAAINGETYEFTEMYPPFIKKAEEEGHTAATRGFKLANEAEKVHGALYQKALDNLGTKDEYDLYLCSVCGHVAEGEAPDKCPICGAKSTAYKKY
ncbi:MAG: rubrerythrin family protein [Veillonellaceae bacterium]|jgi:rubrerythrin|nr:rubrerythrin family protein [Veillonellaceae bacterium]